jgi:hypothetical protein
VLLVEVVGLVLCFVAAFASPAPPSAAPLMAARVTSCERLMRIETAFHWSGLVLGSVGCGAEMGLVKS